MGEALVCTWLDVTKSSDLPIFPYSDVAFCVFFFASFSPFKAREDKQNQPTSPLCLVLSEHKYHVLCEIL